MNGETPRLTDRAEAELAARRDREAAALRANLRRRKEQQRGPAPNPAPPTADHGNTPKHQSQ